MQISLSDLKLILSRFAVVFPLPEQIRHQSDFDGLADIWLAALGDLPKEQVHSACRQLLRKLTRFPYPADVVAEAGNPVPSNAG